MVIATIFTIIYICFIALAQPCRGTQGHCRTHYYPYHSPSPTSRGKWQWLQMIGPLLFCLLNFLEMYIIIVL